MSPSGGARKGAGRKRGKRTSDTIQITVRVNPKTAGKFRAEAEQRLEEERRLRPERKRPKIGKVLGVPIADGPKTTFSPFSYRILRFKSDRPDRILLVARRLASLLRLSRRGRCWGDVPHLHSNLPGNALANINF